MVFDHAIVLWLKIGTRPFIRLMEVKVSYWYTCTDETPYIWNMERVCTFQWSRHSDCFIILLISYIGAYCWYVYMFVYFLWVKYTCDRRRDTWCICTYIICTCSVIYWVWCCCWWRWLWRELNCFHLASHCVCVGGGGGSLWCGYGRGGCKELGYSCLETSQMCDGARFSCCCHLLTMHKMPV